MTTDQERGARELKFRDPARAASLAERLHQVMASLGRRVTVMHVCGSHEQAIARFGLRSILPSDLDLVMGPGCPVCVTDQLEIDQAIAAAEAGARVTTYGDMLRVPGTTRSLADARAAGGRIDVVYSISEAIEMARRDSDPVVFFASGFETTAVATAAALLAGTPDNFSVLSAHRYIPPAMELVAAIPGSRVEGFMAAGHAATITGWGVFEAIAERTKLPIVVAGFEPLDILAALLSLVTSIREGHHDVRNAFPRCVTREGNQRALEQLWRVFKTVAGRWRGIADVDAGSLALRRQWAHVDARLRFRLDGDTPAAMPASRACLCGPILSGIATPADCPLFRRECTPDRPVGACMVSSEGACRIAFEYGGRLDLSSVGATSRGLP